jgi:16S rRNA (uracil1498-N3)-methyltransferase
MVWHACSNLWLFSYDGRSECAAQCILMPPAWYKLPRVFLGAPDAFHRLVDKSAASTGLGLRRDGLYALLPDQVHHLRNVLRCTAGSPVRLFDGEGGEWIGVYDGKSRVTLSDKLRSQPVRRETGLGSDGAWLLFPILKSQDRMQFLLEKATELGVAVLIPTLYARTQRTKTIDAPLSLHGSTIPPAFQFMFDGTHKAYTCPLKWYKWIVEAAEQCERLDVPIVTPIMPFTNLLEAFTSKNVQHPRCELLIADEVLARNNNDDSAASSPTSLTEAIRVLAVGPEGGWSDEERTQFTNCRTSNCEVRAVRLSNNILRAETACIAGLAMLDALSCRTPNI